jgi:lipid-A-disaccharide synthase
MSIAASEYAARHGMQSVLVESAAIDRTHYDRYLASQMIRFRDAAATHELMSHATLGILKSGTTTLEAALLGLPGVICYKTHPVSFAIGKRVVKLAYIGLANIVIGHKLYPELLQKEMTPVRMVAELEIIQRNRDAFVRELRGISDKLRGPAPGPSRHVAEALLA